MEELITLVEFTDWTHAHIVKGRLESEGIPCVLLNENMNNILPMGNFAFGGIQLKVRLSDAHRAFDIYNETNWEEGDSYL